MKSRHDGEQTGGASVWIIAALFLTEMAVNFESSMIYAALPKLIRAFGDPVQAGWLVTAHMLISAATAPVAGRLGDIHGRKRIIMVLLGIALGGSLLSAVSTSFTLVLAGRALQGLSSAVIPLSIGVLRESLPSRRVPFGVGLLTAAQSAGAALGLVLGGAIIDNFQWHMLFAASAVLLAISMAFVAIAVPAMPGSPTSKPIDWFEGLLPVPSIAAILFAIGLAGDVGWFGQPVLGLVAFGLSTLGIWAFLSLRSREPFIELRLFSGRNFAVANGISVFLGMGTLQVIYLFSAYIQSPAWTLVGLGLSATLAGLAKLPSSALAFIAGPLSGWMSIRFGDRATVFAAATLSSAGWLLAAGLPETILEVILLLCMISFGVTMLQAAIPNIIVNAVPDNRTSEAIGSMSVVRGIASAIGAQMIALLLASETVQAPSGGAHFPAANAFQLAMAVMAGLTFVGAIAAFLLKAVPMGNGVNNDRLLADKGKHD